MKEKLRWKRGRRDGEEKQEYKGNRLWQKKKRKENVVKSGGGGGRSQREEDKEEVKKGEAAAASPKPNKIKQSAINTYHRHPTMQCSSDSNNLNTSVSAKIKFISTLLYLLRK